MQKVVWKFFFETSWFKFIDFLDPFRYRNIGAPDPKELEPEEEKSVTPDKTEHTTPTKGKAGKASKEDKKEKEDKKGERKKSAEKRTGTGTAKTSSRRNSMQVVSPPPGATTPVSDIDALR